MAWQKCSFAQVQGFMSISSPGICVVGSSMMDQITRAPVLPHLGQTLVGSSYKTGFGGKGANQAVIAQRLGAPTAFVGKIGADDIGHSTRLHMVEEGVDVRFLFEDPYLPSGVAPIWVDEETGQNAILCVMGANAALGPSDVEQAREVLEGSRVVITQSETPIAANRRALELAKAKNVPTIWNPAPAPPSSDLHQMKDVADIIIPNEHEAASLTGMPTKTSEDQRACAEALVNYGFPTVIITLGDAGALLVGKDRSPVEIPGHPVQAVDTTGAGDCFVGALGYFLWRGEELLQAIDLANRVAAVSVLSHGTQSSYPSAKTHPELVAQAGLA